MRTKKSTSEGLSLSGILDVMGVVAGGADEGVETPFLIGLGLGLDTGRAGWWTGGRFQFDWIGIGGGNPQERAGDVQAPSNIEAQDTVLLLTATFDQSLLEGAVDVRAGLFDVNADFYVSRVGNFFVHSSPGLGAEVGQLPVSTYPVTALGARLRWRPREAVMLQGAVFDGIPGDPGDRHGTQVRFGQDDGVFLIAEAALEPPLLAEPRIALGGWLSTAEFRDPRGRRRDRNGGAYAIAEGDLIRAKGGGRLSFFAQFGFAAGDRNVIARYVGGGLLATGFVPGRREDGVGVAVAHARLGRAMRDVIPEVPRAETAVEVSLRFGVGAGLSVQPHVQWILDPGTDRRLRDATLLGVRFAVLL